MARSSSQVKTVPPVSPRLRRFILGGLALAALVVFFVLFFSPKPQPPKLAVYPGAHVTQTVDNGSSYEVHMQMQGATLTQITAFYQKEFTSTGWIVLNDKIASTPDLRRAVYESQDGEWEVTLDINYQADRGVAFIDLYEQKLGN